MMKRFSLLVLVVLMLGIGFSAVSAQSETGPCVGDAAVTFNSFEQGGLVHFDVTAYEDVTLVGARINWVQRGGLALNQVLLNGSAIWDSASATEDDYPPTRLHLEGAWLSAVALSPEAAATLTLVFAGADDLAAAGASADDYASSIYYFVDNACDVTMGLPLFSPEDGAHITEGLPMFSWAAMEGVTNYVVRVRNADGVLVYRRKFTPEEAHCTQSVCVVDPGSDILKRWRDDVVYSWNVSARHETGVTKSETWTFSTDVIPASITVITPLLGETLTPEEMIFTWEHDANSQIDRYVLRINRPDGRKALHIANETAAICTDATCTVTVSAEQAATLKHNKVYTWHVAGKSYNVKTRAFSEFRNFTADLQPE